MVFILKNGSGAFQCQTVLTCPAAGVALPRGISVVTNKLAHPATGYAELLRDSVDVSSISDSTLQTAKRGEAAGKLLDHRLESATTAGFSQDRVFETFMPWGVQYQ